MRSSTSSPSRRDGGAHRARAKGVLPRPTSMSSRPASRPALRDLSRSTPVSSPISSSIKPAWNDSPLRPRPPSLRGLQCQGTEPWSRDEAVYNRRFTMWSEYDGLYCADSRSPYTPSRVAMSELRRTEYMGRVTNKFELGERQTRARPTMPAPADPARAPIAWPLVRRAQPTTRSRPTTATRLHDPRVHGRARGCAEGRPVGASMYGLSVVRECVDAYIRSSASPGMGLFARVLLF
jgi:hypothetical protein